MTASIVRYWCEISGLPFGKFVIASPIGPLEEPRFCAYLMKTWAIGQVPEVRTLLYVRDNIRVSLLAEVYADFVIEIGRSKRSTRLAPTFYVEPRRFAGRFGREMSQRFAIPCPVRIGVQTDFSEPAVRINTDLIDVARLAWSEKEAWDSIATYYSQQLLA